MPGNSSTLVTKLLEAHGVVLGKMRMVRSMHAGMHAWRLRRHARAQCMAA